MAEIVAEMAAAAVANPLNDSDNEAVKADHSSDEKVARVPRRERGENRGAPETLKI